jgi:ABC-type Fe3+/spermidine/putrescine transport system ATPase subunit
MSVAEDELVVLLGPSGCGKTTLLRCVAGLEKPDEGEILIHGKTVFSSERNIYLPPEGRDLSMIFQSYALWPHMTVFDNVAYPLRSRKIEQGLIAERVKAVLDVAGVGGLEGQYPGRISGGQQQRVALARALVSGSSVVLFDEPLSNVDTQVRARLRLELRKLQQGIRFSGLYVTHDQTEALELGHRVAVLDRGKISDLGPPRRVYDEPANEYVANFVGIANLLTGRVLSTSDRDLTLDTPAGVLTKTVPGRTSYATGDQLTVVLRPEHLRVVKPDNQASARNAFTGKVEALMFAGPHVELVVSIAGVSVRIWVNDNDVGGLAEGSEVLLSISPDKVHLVDRAGARS